MVAIRIPSYHLHKATGQGVVVLSGKSHYLGKFNSPESKSRYDVVVSDWLAKRGKPTPANQPLPVTPPSLCGNPNLTVNDLVLAYWEYAKCYYVKHGKPTGEQWPLKQALRFLRRTTGDVLAIDFGPANLEAVSAAMMAHPITRQVKKRDLVSGKVHLETRLYRIGLSRRTINKHAARVKRVFAWATSQKLLPAAVHETLLRVAGLKKGRSTAREKARVRPVSEEQVAIVFPHLPRTIRAMIEVQRFTGCRPQEVVHLRGVDIDTTGNVWVYRPFLDKSEHRNDDNLEDRERTIYIGPRAQAVLKQFLEEGGTGFLFSPGRSERERNAARRAERASPMTPSQAKRGPGGNPTRPRREHYDVASYRRAIQRACKTAGIPLWSPLQLRHSAGTAIREKFGLEACQAVLGHSELSVTQVYAEVDRKAAQRVMLELG